MSRMAQMDKDEIKQFIYHRVMRHAAFQSVIAVSVEKYAIEYSAVVWIGQEPSGEMRQFAYELEAELEHLGIHCSIIVKSDQELSLGGVHTLATSRGDFSYRYYKLDPLGDEDEVFGFTVFRGDQIYRFRLSLSGTLASMMRNRKRFSEDRILEVYRDSIRDELSGGNVPPEQLNKQMFSSKDIGRFTQ